MKAEYAYLLINLFTISIPLIRSFEHRMQYARKWYALFPAIMITGAIFIAWDVLFTRAGIWGFNEMYLVGVRFLHLPLEEWLFFLTVPYACVFIYEALVYFIKKDILGPIAKPFSIVLGITLVLLAFLFSDQMYTFVTFLSTGLFLFIVVFIIKPKYLGRFYLGYLVSLIPFFLVNGVLTGSWIRDQIVWYNNAENFGIRLGTIPVEDSVYLLLLLLLNVVIYEKILDRF